MPLALPPNGYPPLGILDLDCGHSRSYNLQSIVVVSSQSCSNTCPCICTYIVFWNTSATQVKVTETTLGSNIAMVCSSFEPFHCIPVVLRHAFTIRISQGHFVLSFGITGIGPVECAIHIGALNWFLDCQHSLLPGSC